MGKVILILACDQVTNRYIDSPLKRPEQPEISGISKYLDSSVQLSLTLNPITSAVFGSIHDNH